MYTISFVRFFNVIKAKGTSGGTVPHRSGPGVGVRVAVTVPVIVAVTVTVDVVAMEDGAVPVTMPVPVDVAARLAVPVVSGAVVAVLAGFSVAVGAGVFVNVGSGVLEGGMVGEGSAIRVWAACVRASATDVACASLADIGDKPGMHALRAADNARTTKKLRCLIHTS
jgi:hypothetical protein